MDLQALIQTHYFKDYKFKAIRQTQYFRKITINTNYSSQETVGHRHSDRLAKTHIVFSDSDNIKAAYRAGLFSWPICWVHSIGWWQYLGQVSPKMLLALSIQLCPYLIQRPRRIRSHSAIIIKTNITPMPSLYIWDKTISRL